MVSAYRKPGGPAHISIPVDIQSLGAGSGTECCDIATLFRQPEVVDTQSFDALCQVLLKVHRVVLFLGNECRGSVDAIMQFAELMDAVIVTTPSGKGCVDAHHRLYRGVFGFAGHRSARKALTDNSVGLILAVGTNLNAWSTSGWDTVLLNNKMVHIHDSTANFVRSPMAHLHVHGTINTIFKELISRLENEGHKRKPSLKRKNTEEETPYVPRQIEVLAPDGCRLESTSHFIKPQRVIREIIQRFPRRTRFLIDNSNSVPWSIHYFFHRRPESYHLSIGFASMGWAIGASVGMALGTPDTPVVCFTGDGCFLMSGQEITVAVQEQLPVIFVVLNDQAYGMIKHGHRSTGTEPVDLSIPPVDFCMMAKAVGANAHTIRHPEDFEQLNFQELYRRNGPTLLDVYIDPDEIPPLGMA